MANRSDGLASKSAAQQPPDELMRTAEEATGLQDWGADRLFRIGLGHLVAAVNATAPPAIFLPGALHQAGGRRQAVGLREVDLFTGGFPACAMEEGLYCGAHSTV